MWTTLPMVTCLNCAFEIQVDDYYDLDSGDTIFCPHCEKDMHVWARDTTISVDVRKEPEQ